MINAVPTSAVTPTASTTDNTSSGTPLVPTIPPQILPSHSSAHAPQPIAPTPSSQPSSLSESLASKVNGSVAPAGDSTHSASTGSVPPQPPEPEKLDETSAMPPQKPRSSSNVRMLLGVLLFVLLVIGAAATYFLTQNSQDIRQRASTGDVYGTPTPNPATPTPQPPDSSLSNCQKGLFSCANRTPADCSSHNEGQGCYYTTAGCQCGSTNNTDSTGASCNAGNGSATVCAGTTALTVCVLECNQPGRYTGDSCNYGCDGTCSSRTVPAGTCQSFGSTNSCGRWQVDVHGPVSCATSGCSTASCDSQPTPTPTPAPTSQQAPLGHHDENTCEVVRGWTCDPDKFDQNVEVHFWIGTANQPESFIGSTTANQPALVDPVNDSDRTTIAASCGGNSSRRFSFAIPPTVKSQVGKYIYAFAINIDKNGNPTHANGAPIEAQNKQLIGSPIVIQNCASSTPTPTPTPTPSTPPAAGPMCMTLTAKNEQGQNLTANTQLTVGQKITFTCGQVPGVSQYAFRVKYADGTVEAIPVSTTPNVSAFFTVTKTQNFKAQCTICPNGKCYPFDNGATPSPTPVVSPTPTPTPMTTPTPTSNSSLSCASIQGASCVTRCTNTTQIITNAIGCDRGLICCGPRSGDM